MKKFLALSLVLALMCGSVFARGDIDNKVGGVKRGSDAPLFTTKDINGNLSEKSQGVIPNSDFTQITFANEILSESKQFRHC